MRFGKIIKILIYTLLIFTLISFKVQNLAFSESPTSSPTDSISPTPTPDPEDNKNQRLSDLQNQIKELQGKLSDLQGQEKTLSSQISVMDSQVKLTELKINATKQEIFELSKDIETANTKIETLEDALSRITKVLFNRINATYQVASFNNPLNLFLSSNNVSSFFTRTNYMRIVQAHDKKVIFATQQAKNDYANQKDIYEEKKDKVELLKNQLESYTAQLDQEKKSKQALLDVTKNDEKKYQDMLAQARAEYQAILGISQGLGSETEVSSVNEGDVIASVISGASACSSGTHLHFEVNNGSHQNPANYLSSKDVDWDLCGWFGCDSQFSFNGSWSWPIAGRPRITQGYGMTAYASNTRAYGGGPHTGIDMVSDDLAVKSVKNGILYRGSIACGGGRLKYVRVKHNEGGLDSLYLHVNYVL